MTQPLTPMSDTPTPPALSHDEWKTWIEKGDLNTHIVYRREGSDCITVDDLFASKDQHALAALCLYQQPFGFTHEDVVCLQDLAAWVVTDSDYAKGVLSLASRIASLLPPEAP